MGNLSNINNKFLVTTGGNVGINTTSPSQKVEITGGYLKFSGGDYGIQGSASLTYNPVSDHYFQASGSTKVTFKADGKVGIGTSSPSKQLMLYGNTPFIRLEDTQGGSKRLDLWVDSNAVAHIDANQSAQQITFRTASTDRLRITNAGNVGIGTILPNHKLDIYSNENVPLRIHRPSNANLNSSGAWGIGFSTRGDAITSTTDTRAGIFSYYNGNLFFATNNSSIVADPDASARMTILNNGNVGIGATNPLRKLHVVGNMAVNAGTGEYYGILMQGGESANPSILIGDWHNSSGTIKWDSTGNYLRIDSQHSTANAAILFSGNDGATEYMRITSGGNVGIGTTSPNATLHVNGSAHFGTDSGVLNPSTGEVLIETVQGGTPALKMYPYNGGVFEVKSDGTTATIGWGSGADREVNILNTGAGKISVGINSGAPSTLLHLDQTSNDRAGGLYIERNGSSYGLSAFVNSGGYGVIGSNGNFTTDIITMDLNNGNVGIGNDSPSVRLEVGSNDSEVEALSVRYSTVPAYISSSFDGSYALSTFSTNQYNTSDGSAGWGSMSNASYGTASVQLAANTQGGELRFFTAPGANQDPTERMRIDSSGRVEVKSRVLSIDAVDEYRENFTTTGNATPSFDIDVKSIGASGQPFEVFVAWTHYSTSYGAGLHQAYYQRSTVQSNITLIHTYFNQTSTLGGAWSVSYVNATTIRVSKSAGTHAGAGYGYIRVTRLKP